MVTDTQYHKKSILQIVPFVSCGGLDRGTIDISKALVNCGYGSFVVSGGGNLSHLVNESGGVLIKKFIDSKNPLSIFFTSLYLSKIIKSNNIDLIHARSRSPAWSGYLAAKSNNIPFVTTFHGIYGHGNFISKYYNSVMLKGDIIIAVSNFVRNHILETYKTDESKIRLIHGGVDTEIFKPFELREEIYNKFLLKYRIPNSVPVLLVPSRFSNRKGHEILIKALDKIKQKEFYCIFVGDVSKHPRYVQKISDMIKSMKLQSKIQIFATEPKLTSLYNLADIVICPSIEPEAFGKTIVEAQSMQKLVIASNIGGVRETLSDNKTGFKFENENISELSDKICYALSIIGTSKYTEITTQARQNVIDNFSLKLMQDKTISVYKELI